LDAGTLRQISPAEVDIDGHTIAMRKPRKSQQDSAWVAFA
jgi:hypothetical protein